MTPTSADTPLRRSEVGTFREQAQNVTINDDEEERRQARRRTMMQTTSGNESSTLEESETLKKCLEIYNGNKLSRDNAWSLSLIDTLSTLLDRHHKSLNNFKVAGSSLEASSKVYGLRVDSVHTDVLRMSAGLNAQKFSERSFEDDDDGVATGGDDAANPNSSAAGADANVAGEKTAPAKKQKRQRKAVSTITKNKDTLNARLDTVPLQDPVFGKLNSIVGSINSSNRLMNNILLTTESELRLRTNFKFWDGSELEKCDYTADAGVEGGSDGCDENSDLQLAPCDRLFKVQSYAELQLRPLHTGYVISDTPEAIADDKGPARRLSLESSDDAGVDADAAYDAPVDNEMSMAFDINAECEPMPLLTEPALIVDVDYAEFDDLTKEERTAINNCRGLRKAPVLIEDLRPVDASSKLEYSYRPLDKISQFWAGPSHWKFKRTRTRPSTLAQQDENSGGRNLNQRGRRTGQLQKKRSKQLNFTDIHDDLFVKLDKNFKARKTNFQKKWDQRKLKLPTDLRFDQNMFNIFKFAPGLPVEPEQNLQNTTLPTIHKPGDDIDDEHGMLALADDHFADNNSVGENNFMNVSSMSNNTCAAVMSSGADGADSQDEALGIDDNVGNNTVLEIATEFEGAPSQVTKIIVPFAKRAKVIDMKNLKRCCTQLITKQMKRAVTESEIPKHEIIKDEKYTPGMASFQDMYEHLPEILTHTMAESLSPSIAFYSVLHLANDCNFRLIQEPNLEDFKIRQLME